MELISVYFYTQKKKFAFERSIIIFKTIIFVIRNNDNFKLLSSSPMNVTKLRFSRVSRIIYNIHVIYARFTIENVSSKLGLKIYAHSPILPIDIYDQYLSWEFFLSFRSRREKHPVGIRVQFLLGNGNFVFFRRIDSSPLIQTPSQRFKLVRALYADRNSTRYSTVYSGIAEWAVGWKKSLVNSVPTELATRCK